jgi:hypothetical protein
VSELSGSANGEIDYDGRVFRSSDPATPDATRGELLGHYHQRGELVWAEFGGGRVAQGRLVGICRSDGSLDFAYCQVLANGDIVAGRCVSTPVRRDDGRIALKEQWRRMDSGASGVSWIEECRRS